MSYSFEFSKDQVKKYNNKPANYEELSRIIEMGFFNSGDKILDIGCGDGKLTAVLAGKLPDSSVVGCDVSTEMIEYAKSHYVASNLDFLKKNASNLNFFSEFDVVVSFNCLQWIKNQKRVIEHIFQALKIGGRAILLAAPKTKNNDFKTICRNVIFSWKWFFYFINFRPVHSFHSEEEYREILLSSGFTIDHIKTKQVELVFETRDELESFFKAVLTPLNHLNLRHQAAFLEDLFQELYRLERIDKNGVIHILFDQVEMVARRL